MKSDPTVTRDLKAAVLCRFHVTPMTTAGSNRIRFHNDL